MTRELIMNDSDRIRWDEVEEAGSIRFKMWADGGKLDWARKPAAISVLLVLRADKPFSMKPRSSCVCDECRALDH